MHKRIVHSNGCPSLFTNKRVPARLSQHPSGWDQPQPTRFGAGGSKRGFRGGQAVNKRASLVEQLGLADLSFYPSLEPSLGTTRQWIQVEPLPLWIYVFLPWSHNVEIAFSFALESLQVEAPSVFHFQIMHTLGPYLYILWLSLNVLVHLNLFVSGLLHLSLFTLSVTVSFGEWKPVLFMES